MRVVLTHVYCWPYVRRGTERNMDGLARYLTAQGHDVTTVSTRPGSSVVEDTDTGRRILYAQRWTPLMGKLRIQPGHLFFLQSLHALRRLSADIVHSWSFSDSIAASLTRRRGHRTVLHFNGAPIPTAYYRRFPPDRWIIREAIRRADRLLACSGFVSRLLKTHYDAVSVVIPPPVDLSLFPLGRGPADGRQVILGVGDFDVPRKGVRVLARAFGLAHRKAPGARLVLSGRMSSEMRSEVMTALPPDAAAHVTILGVGQPEDLPGLYGAASVLAFPSMQEPAGTVMFESWAAGTPVVAANHGGPSEFMGDGVGVLFDPVTDGEETHNAEGLAEALLEGLALADREDIRRRCRAHAEQFSWKTLGPAVEAMYRDLRSRGPVCST